MMEVTACLLQAWRQRLNYSPREIAFLRAECHWFASNLELRRVGTSEHVVGKDQIQTRSPTFR